MCWRSRQVPLPVPGCRFSPVVAIIGLALAADKFRRLRMGHESNEEGGRGATNRRLPGPPMSMVAAAAAPNPGPQVHRLKRRRLESKWRGKSSPRYRGFSSMGMTTGSTRREIAAAFTTYSPYKMKPTLTKLPTTSIQFIPPPHTLACAGHAARWPRQRCELSISSFARLAHLVLDRNPPRVIHSARFRRQGQSGLMVRMALSIEIRLRIAGSSGCALLRCACCL